MSKAPADSERRRKRFPSDRSEFNSFSKNGAAATSAAASTSASTSASRGDAGGEGDNVRMDVDVGTGVDVDADVDVGEDEGVDVDVDVGEAKGDAESDTSKEIYTYQAPWTVYAMNWSVRPDRKFRLAVGSFIEEYNNKVNIVQLDPETRSFKCTSSFDHPYPCTKIMFIPDKQGSRRDILATTGDYLRLWDVKDDGVSMRCLLNNVKHSEFCAPLTSFDWNETDPTIIGTSSIDTTCTIWDIETQKAKTQLIAHDKEVYDIAFAPSPSVFASAGADGSVRMFDLRNLDHSTIIYETSGMVPLLRLRWNKQDHNYIATFPMNSNNVVILDIRAPSVPVAELKGHNAPVNCIAWAPHSPCHICTGGDDTQALIWDLSPIPRPVTEPMLAYDAQSEINTLQWSVTQYDWVAIAFADKLQILRV